MAGDWIKWTKGLAKRPEVLQMAHMLGRSRHEVAGLLCEFWEWADDNADAPENVSAFCPHFVRMMSATHAVVDAISGAQGFAEAMQKVGWLVVGNDVIEFPRFGRHNGKSAKRRLLDSERKRQTRPQNVRMQSGKKRDQRREEKRRESTKVDSPYSPPCDFDAFWKLWPRQRRKSRGAAAKAWKAATAKISAESLLAAAAEYAVSDEGRGDFVKMPSTWLNQECWNDDRAAWRDKIAGKAAGVGQERNGHIDTLFESIKSRDAFQGHPVRPGGMPLKIEFEGEQELSRRNHDRTG